MSVSLGPIGQLGYAVHEIDSWIDNYLAAGIGPWWVYEDMAPTSFEYLGKETPARYRVGISWSGPLRLELIQPVDDHPSPYRDYLARGLEGLQHVCYFPADANTARAGLVAAGFTKIVDGTSGHGFHFTYFHRSAGTPEAIEIGDLTPAAASRLEAQRATCSVWDGVHPRR